MEEDYGFTAGEWQVLHCDDHRQVLGLLIDKVTSGTLSPESLSRYCHEERDRIVQEQLPEDRHLPAFLKTKGGRKLTLMAFGYTVLSEIVENQLGQMLNPDNASELKSALCQPERLNQWELSTKDPFVKKFTDTVDFESRWWRDGVNRHWEMCEQFVALCRDPDFGLRRLSERPGGMNSVLAALTQMSRWELAAAWDSEHPNTVRGQRLLLAQLVEPPSRSVEGNLR